jgi:hypothetical protein
VDSAAEVELDLTRHRVQIKSAALAARLFGDAIRSR